jgi:hypothetical protein
MEDFDKYLDQLVENFYDTGRVVLNETTDTINWDKIGKVIRDPNKSEQIYELLIDMFPNAKEVIDYNYYGDNEEPSPNDTFAEMKSFLWNIDKNTIKGPDLRLSTGFEIDGEYKKDLEKKYDDYVGGKIDKYFRDSSNDPRDTTKEGFKSLPPILVMGKKVIDGNHRTFLAQKVGAELSTFEMVEEPNTHPNAQKILSIIHPNDSDEDGIPNRLDISQEPNLNEHDSILDRIVGEFFDTGRLVLNEVGGFQSRTVREVGGLSWEIFNTGQKGRGSQKEVNNYISMIEKFLTLNDRHKRIITEKNWWKPNDYVNIIDRYLNDTNRPINDKLNFYNRIKEISDKLDNTPFSELKDIIKPFETFLRSKDELEKKQEDETPEVEKDLYVPDNTEEIGDTEQTPEGETEVEEKRDITSIAKEVVKLCRVKTALIIESDKILNTLIGDPKDKEDTIEIIGILEKEIEDLNTRIGEINNLTGNDRVDSEGEYDKKIKERNNKINELEEYEQELKDLKSNPILYLLLNKRCLINTLVYGVNDSLERRELVNILKERFVKPLSQYESVPTYSLHSTHFDKFKNKYGEPLADKIKRYIVTPGTVPSETDEELEFCGVEEFDNTRIISRKKEEINNEYQGKDEKKTPKIKQLLNQAFNLVNEIFNEFMSNTQLQQKYAKSERYYKLIEIIKNYWSGDNDDERLYSLYNIIFDLNELLKLIKGLKGDRITDNIDDLINNIYGNVNDSDIIRDNFKEIRENNNLKYEKSFGCNNNEYFKYTTGGDTSSILGKGTNNNQILKNMMNIIISSMVIPETYTEKDKDGNDVNHNSQDFIGNQSFDRIIDDYIPNFSTETYEKKIEWCVDTLYDNIKSDDINKYDIISTSPVTVGSGSTVIVIPKDSQIEVKDTDSKEYHLSEFFGVYKDSKLPLGYKKIPQYRKIYNDIIKGLYEKINSLGDKDILRKIYDNTKGLFFRNYKYIPLEEGMLSWSLDGQRKKSEGMDEYRLTVRVNMEGQTEYQWTTQNGNCNCEPFLKGVECPQNESTDRLDNIIENFFDTGNFDI